jgi:hypothetical protein
MADSKSLRRIGFGFSTITALTAVLTVMQATGTVPDRPAAIQAAAH